MLSHLGPTENAIQKNIYDISHDNCKTIHKTGIFEYDNARTIADSKINSTKSVGLDVAGNVVETFCWRAAYADRLGTWSNVFVLRLIKMTFIESYTAVESNDDELRSNSGTVCKFSDQHCVAMKRGYIFWSLSKLFLV